MKFRTKPVIKEATKFTGGISVDEMCVEWGAPFCEAIVYTDFMNTLTIKTTFAGPTTVNLGDYVVKGLDGDFYSYKSENFEKLYERVEE